MQVSVARAPLYAAGLVVIVAAAVTGCNGNPSASAGSSSPASASATANALDAVKLAAKTSSSANSFTGTMELQSTVKPGATTSSGSAGAVSMTATFAEQLHPSLLASVDIESLASGGTSLPGGLAEVVTPTTLYLKWSFLTQEMHEASRGWPSRCRR